VAGEGGWMNDAASRVARRGRLFLVVLWSWREGDSCSVVMMSCTTSSHSIVHPPPHEAHGESPQTIHVHTTTTDPHFLKFLLKGDLGPLPPVSSTFSGNCIPVFSPPIKCATCGAQRSWAGEQRHVLRSSCSKHATAEPSPCRRAHALCNPNRAAAR
jgi:hypothetical protein